MKLIDHAKEGLANLYHAKLRSLLALLGVLVGTASVVAMVLGGELATYEALQQFKSLGTDLLAITINSNEENTSSTGKIENLNLQQALSLQSSDHNILELAPYTQIFHPTFYEGHILDAMILGVTESFADILKIKLQSGRFILSADNYNFFCVIGHDLYQSIKQLSAREPLGQQLQIGKNIFIIVGVAENWPENSFIYANINSSILIPILASTLISKYATINNIIAKLAPDADISAVETHINHKIENLISQKQINFRSARELITKMQNQNNILSVFLGLIGSISLLVGGIGVMNIMLVSVIERKREIGIRLAVGATPKDIGALFLTEAVMLALVGGFAGVIIGILIAYLIAWWWQWQFTLFLWPPIVGFSVSVAVGIFFGFYPAYQASQLNPIDALRAE